MAIFPSPLGVILYTSPYRNACLIPLPVCHRAGWIPCYTVWDLLRPAAALHPPQLPCTHQRDKKREQLLMDLLARDEPRLLQTCDKRWESWHIESHKKVTLVIGVLCWLLWIFPAEMTRRHMHSYFSTVPFSPLAAFLSHSSFQAKQSCTPVWEQEPCGEGGHSPPQARSPTCIWSLIPKRGTEW